MRNGRSAVDGGIYIAVEGVDGSGKTTLFRGLAAELERRGVDYSVACPTRALGEGARLEEWLRRFRALGRSRWCRAFLYAQRSRRAFEACDWSKPVVLGDRSIVTSYVARWRHVLGSARASRWLVDGLEPHLPVPRHVLFLDAPWEVRRERLRRRGLPLGIDETRGRSRQMEKAYREIMASNVVPCLQAVRWHVLDGTEDVETVLRKAWSIIMQVGPRSLCRSDHDKGSIIPGKRVFRENREYSGT